MKRYHQFHGQQQPFKLRWKECSCAIRRVVALPLGLKLRFGIYTSADAAEEHIKKYTWVQDRLI